MKLLMAFDPNKILTCYIESQGESFFTKIRIREAIGPYVVTPCKS